MSQYDSLNKPLLNEKDEEYQMLFEVAEEYLDQQKEKTPQNKSGKATEIVIREHLLRKGFNLTSNPNVKILGSKIKNDLLLLKPAINPHNKEYSPDEVDMVIEIKNNAVANQSRIIKENFDELKELSSNLRFGVIVLSERKGYTHEIVDEKLGDGKYLSFTLVSRRVYPEVGGLYSKKAIVDLLKNNEMKRTGDWERLIAYLKNS